MPVLLAQLLAQGLGLIGSAVLNKGKAVVEQKLGVSLDLALESPEGKQQLLQLQVDHEEFLITSALADKQLDATDTSSARAMNTQISTSEQASFLATNIVPVLALIVVIGGGWTIATSSVPDVRLAAVAIVTLVLGFYFGSSSASKTKDATIANLTAPSGV